MALTLPYPSLVFVPLDKLTAEEMNQIVANYQAIANQFLENGNISGSIIAPGTITNSQMGANSVGADQIKDQAVTSTQVKWSTMKKWAPMYTLMSSTNIAVGNNATITQDGWAVIWVHAHNNVNSFTVKVTVNGKEIWAHLQEADNPSNGVRAVAESFMIPVSSGDHLSLDYTGSTLDLFSVTMIPGAWV